MTIVNFTVQYQELNVRSIEVVIFWSIYVNDHKFFTTFQHHSHWETQWLLITDYDNV